MKMPQYCFTERGAALFSQLDLQSHMKTQRNTTLRPHLLPPESAARNRHGRQGRMWDIVAAWVLPKESSAYACTLDPPRHLGDPMSVVRPLDTRKVPGELTALLQPLNLSLARASAATRPSLRIYSQYP